MFIGSSLRNDLRVGESVSFKTDLEKLRQNFRISELLDETVNITKRSGMKVLSMEFTERD